MKETTLCYIERNDEYLMLHRTKKHNDENGGKWIGVGGKLEAGETPLECAIREIREETGLDVGDNLVQRGIIYFYSDKYEAEKMYLYTVDTFFGEISDCDEGELAWIPKSELGALSMWEGDRIFIELLLRDASYFELELRYSGEKLISACLNGNLLEL